MVRHSHRSILIDLSAYFVYHLSQMRRVLSIFLVLFFAIGPLPGSLGAKDDDARLPACCRRHGTHHCAMSEETVARWVRGTLPSVSAPSHCPLYPDDSLATTSPVYTLAGRLANSVVSPVQAHAPAAPQAVLRDGQIHTHTSRGPPTLILL